MSTFPQPFNSCTSHWQATNRGANSLYGHNKSKSPPKDADIVIIGGGMMGAALAYFLTRPGAEGERRRIVLVEAKDIGSGASGRNGGHIGPATFESYHSLITPLPKGAGLSQKEAVHVIQAERDNLDLISSIIVKEGLAATVDFWRGELCEVHPTEEYSREMEEMYHSWLSARAAYGLPGNGDTSFIKDPVEAKRISRFKEVASVHMRPGGSVHSHKLCTELMRLAIESPHSDFDAYSWTPVSSVDAVEDCTSEKVGKRWVVRTGKGNIVAKRVVLCTNAHTQNFFPAGSLIYEHIRPRKSQVALITPPATFSGEFALHHSYNTIDDGYLMQTPMGGIVLGGGSTELIREGKLDPKLLDSVDDSTIFENWADLLAEHCPKTFEGWGPEAVGEGLTRVWTGILSSTKDTLPLVGPVPGSDGLFLAAGFHGHGMSRIFSTGRALAQQLQTGTFNESLLPRSFELSTARLQRCKEASGVTPLGKSRRNETLFNEKGTVVAERSNPMGKKSSSWGCIIS